MSSITVSNCIRFYEVAEEIDATVLRDHCSNLISAHWTDFTAKDFAAMGAPLLFKMFKVSWGDVWTNESFSFCEMPFVLSFST